jgi:uncharacterized OsmC-like protein
LSLYALTHRTPESSSPAVSQAYPYPHKEPPLTTTRILNQVDLAAVSGLAEAISADPEKAQTRWGTSVEWNGGFRTQSSVRQFDPVPCDEPAALGGTDTAPNPVEQLLSALGSCLAVGVAANASARGVAIESLQVSVEGDLDLSAFLGLAEGHAGFSDIRAEIALTSSASAEDVDDLLQHVVATSPVGHTLSRSIPLTVTHH